MHSNCHYRLIFSIYACSKSEVLGNPIIRRMYEICRQLHRVDSAGGLIDSGEEKRRKKGPERSVKQEKKIKNERLMETEMEKYGMQGYGLLCPAERLQMALRIKSKSVLTAKEWVLRHIRCHSRVGEVDWPQWRRLKSKGCSHRVEIAFKWLF